MSIRSLAADPNAGIQVFLLATAALLCSCTSVGQLDATTAPPMGTEAVFVLGVAPDNHRVSLFPGEIRQGVFRQDQWRNAALYGAAKDGYVVGKGQAGDVLAITNVRMVADATAIQGKNFRPCGAAKTMVFELPPGNVIYLGNVEYEFSGARLSVRYGQDFDAARRHVDANYPALRGKLQPARFKLMPVAMGCEPSATPLIIPIYIPRK